MGTCYRMYYAYLLVVPSPSPDPTRDLSYSPSPSEPPLFAITCVGHHEAAAVTTPVPWQQPRMTSGGCLISQRTLPVVTE